MNKRLCTVNGKKGLVIASYTHTYDILLFKSKIKLGGVSKRVVKLLPLPKLGDKNQQKLELWPRNI